MMALDTEIYIYSTINVNIVKLLSLKHLFIFIIIVLVLIVPLGSPESRYQQLVSRVDHVIPIMIVLVSHVVHHPVH